MKVSATLATILGVAYAAPEARVGSMDMRSNMARQQQQLIQPRMDMMSSNMANQQQQQQQQQLMQPHMDLMRSNIVNQEPLVQPLAGHQMPLRMSPMRTMYRDLAMGPKQKFLQDKFGNYAYSYANQNSEKMEQGDQNSVKGHYAYIMSNGQKRRVDYIADNHGFHVIRDDADNVRTKRSVEPDLIQTKMTSYMDSSSLRDNSRDMFRMMSPNNMMYRNRMGMMNNQMSQGMGHNMYMNNDMSSQMISQDMSTNMMNRNMMEQDMSNSMMYSNMRSQDMPNSIIDRRNIMDISNNMRNNHIMGQDMLYGNMNMMNQDMNMMDQGMKRMNSYANNDLMGQNRNMMSQRMKIEQIPSNRF